MKTRAKTHSKKANGLGTIYYRADRKRWEARKTIGRDPQGRPIRRTVTGTTQKQCLERLGRVTQSVNITGLKNNPTVADWVDHWLTNICAGDKTKDVTRLHKWQVMKCYILPNLGHLKLEALHHTHISQMLRKLNADGLSPQTQRTALKVLRHCLNTAIRHEVIAKNYAAPVYHDGIGVKRREVQAMTRDEARRLLRYVDLNESTTIRSVIHLLVSRGLRRGECLGISWDDLDFKTGNLVIRRNLTRIPLANEAGQIAPDAGGEVRSQLNLGTTKTRKSARTVSVPREVLQILREHRTQQTIDRDAFETAENGLPFGGKWNREHLMFTTPLGTPLDPDNFRNLFNKLTAAAGLGFWTVHQMRHTCASLLIQAGVPPKEISDMLGHESIKITLDTYGHLFPESRSITSDKASEILYK